MQIELIHAILSIIGFIAIVSLMSDGALLESILIAGIVVSLFLAEKNNLAVMLIFIIIIVYLICNASNGVFLESSLIGIIILLIIAQKVDLSRVVNIPPIMSMILGAFTISAFATLFSMLIRGNRLR